MLKIISDEKIMAAHEGEKCRDCGRNIAQAQLEADQKEYDKLYDFTEGCIDVQHDLIDEINKLKKEHKRIIKELNEDWEATLKVASNKKLSDILLDKEQEVSDVKTD